MYQLGLLRQIIDPQFLASSKRFVINKHGRGAERSRFGGIRQHGRIIGIQTSQNPQFQIMVVPARDPSRKRFGTPATKDCMYSDRRPVAKDGCQRFGARRFVGIKRIR